MIHCNAHGFTRAGPWQPGLKGGVSVGKQRIAQRECLSHETWHMQDSLGRNYLPPGLCIWICVCPPWMMSARKEFSSSLPGQDIGTWSLWHIVSEFTRLRQEGDKCSGPARTPWWNSCFLKKGQVNESFKQTEETPTKLSVPQPKVFYFVFFAQWPESLLNFLTEWNTKHPMHLEMLPPVPVSTSGTWPRHT